MGLGPGYTDGWVSGAITWLVIVVVTSAALGFGCAMCVDNMPRITVKFDAAEKQDG